MANGFTFLGKKPEDFQEYSKMSNHAIGYPVKKKILKTVPFSNAEYDFSTIYGEQTYGTRQVAYTINIVNPQALHPQTTHILANGMINWLLSADTKQPLYDDQDPRYHFMGEVREEPKLTDAYDLGSLSVTFTCDPYRIKNLAEGNDIWDEIDWDDDVFQEVEWKVDGELTVPIINQSAHSVEYKLETTDYITSDIGPLLKPGITSVTFKGKGSVKLVWNVEVI